MFKSNSIEKAVMLVIKGRLKEAQKALNEEEKALVEAYNANVTRENESHREVLSKLESNLNLDKNSLLSKHVNAVLEKVI